MAKTLLVADDAAIVRAKIKDAARLVGWEIVGEARNGREAIERYLERAENPSRFQLPRECRWP